jgi:tetratricopeptide (TPR) repeat protein
MITTRVLFALLVLSSIFFVACSKPAEAPSSAVPIFTDLGSHHRAVTTSNEMAQKYFDQGLRLIYGFNHDEAERAFREAIRLDPSCAMAWWGVAYALGPNYNLPMNPERNQQALEAVQKAQSLQSQSNDAERGLVAAIATRYSADPKADRVQLDHSYSAAMKELHERLPEDNDIAVLYAESLMDLKPWQLWTHDGKPQPGTTEIVSLLESVLQRDPNHPGANHYYIHAIEASPNADKGQASAERLKTLVPGAGHLVHMPAHIFIRTGDYRGAIDANANAAKADEAYFGKTSPGGTYPMMYYTHNFQFLSTAAGMIGQSSRAIDSALKAVSVVAPMIGHEPAVEYVLPWPLYAMARNEKWNEILGFPRPSDATPSTQAFWFYARGMAQAAKGNMNEAKKARAELEATKAKVPADFMLNTNRAHDLLSIAMLVLDARIAGMAGDRNAAIAAWKKAVDVQDSLIYDEPPAWYYPVRESLGGEYLRTKQFKDAEAVFRRDLEKNPNNPRSLFGLREALRGQSRSAEAEQAGNAFDKAWQNAELQISVDKL